MQDVGVALGERYLPVQGGIERVGDIEPERKILRPPRCFRLRVAQDGFYALFSGVFSGAEPARLAPTCACVKKDFHTSSPVSAAQSCKVET